MLPTYQRIGGTSQPSNPLLAVRRSFRSSEKCLILLVLLTFGFVCFGGFFFLPDNFGADRVLKAYKQFQRAGPEIFIPPPPPAHGLLDGDEDPHKLNDREKLQEKIQKELPDDFLEKPDLDEDRTGGPEFDNVLDSGAPGAGAEAPGPMAGGPDGVVAPPQILDEPDVRGAGGGASSSASGAFQTFNSTVGEDPDPTVREKRNKVKEVSLISLLCFCVCGVGLQQLSQYLSSLGLNTNALMYLL